MREKYLFHSSAKLKNAWHCQRPLNSFKIEFITNSLFLPQMSRATCNGTADSDQERKLTNRSRCNALTRVSWRDLIRTQPAALFETFFYRCRYMHRRKKVHVGTQDCREKFFHFGLICCSSFKGSSRHSIMTLCLCYLAAS